MTYDMTSSGRVFMADMIVLIASSVSMLDSSFWTFTWLVAVMAHPPPAPEGRSLNNGDVLLSRADNASSERKQQTHQGTGWRGGEHFSDLEHRPKAREREGSERWGGKFSLLSQFIHLPQLIELHSNAHTITSSYPC